MAYPSLVRHARLCYRETCPSRTWRPSTRTDQPVESQPRSTCRSHRVARVSWTEHAVAEFGERPQAILNGQIVDQADVAVALFYDRLGTPTGEAESGTAERSEVLVDAGKSVAVLVGNRPPARH